MEERQPRSSSTMILVILAGAAVYFGVTQYFGIGQEEGEQAQQAQQTEQTEQAQGETTASEGEENSAQAGEGEESAENSEGSEGSADASPGEGETTPGRAPEDRRTATITTERFVATIDNFGGGISSFRLLGDERYTEETEDGGREPLNLITTDREEYQALRMSLGENILPEDLVWEIEQVSPTRVRLSTERRGLRIVRSLSAGSGPYQVWSTVRVTNVGRADRRIHLAYSTHHYVTHDQESGGSFLPLGSRSWYISNGLCLAGGDLEREPHDDLEEEDGGKRFTEGVQMAAVENVYFVQAIAVHGAQQAESCTLDAEPRGGTVDDPAGHLLVSHLVYPQQAVEPGQSVQYRTMSYLGPKDPDALHAAAHGLPEVIDLGFFAIIARQLVRLLSFIHELVGNWGLAIILMTLMIRLLLSPLTLRMYRSTARMRLLKPELDRINEIYGDDREKKGAATMELYRKHKINPLGGCLPQMLQLPIWWALYTSLSSNIELFHMPFFGWLNDLSAPDEWKILPLTLGLLMFLQQKLTPTTADPGQAKMMLYLMPGMFTAMMLFLPSGLCLYMLTNAALGIVQQKAVESFMMKSEGGEGGEGGGEEEAGDSPDIESSSTKGKRPKVRQRRRRGRA